MFRCSKNNRVSLSLEEENTNILVLHGFFLVNIERMIGIVFNTMVFII